MPSQIYLFYGEEDLLIKEKINEQKRALGDDSLNVEQIDAEQLDLERLVSALQTQTLLFGPKLIIVRHADLKSKEWEALLPALRSLPANTTLVIWAAAVDKRAKIYKLIDDLGEVCEFRSFAPWEQDQVVAWIKRRAQASGKMIDTNAATSLLEICGSNLMKLASEINKLITYVGQQQQVTVADVLALASPGQISVFALSDAVASKDLKKSLSAFRALARDKVELLPVLAMIANRFRIMLLGMTVKDNQRVAQIL
ncbi:MAG: DNA polymerase III subunit delta, partial [Candidatus Margulisiibacteriota bacterium]